MFHSLLNHCPIVEHLGGFQDFPIMNRAVTNIFLQIAYIPFQLFSWYIFPEEGLLGQRLDTLLWLLLWGVRLFSRNTVLVCSSPVFLFMFCSLWINPSTSCSKSSGPAWGSQPPSPYRGDFTEEVTGTCPWISSTSFHVNMSIFTLAPLLGWSLKQRWPISFPNKTLCLCVWPHSLFFSKPHCISYSTLPTSSISPFCPAPSPQSANILKSLFS